MINEQNDIDHPATPCPECGTRGSMHHPNCPRSPHAIIPESEMGSSWTILPDVLIDSPNFSNDK